jgi:hypothetical protein
MSFTVQNLPPALKYVLFITYILFNNLLYSRCRAKNLLVPLMTPGPTEPTAEELQHYLKIVVDDLILLYEKGVRIPTPSNPNGQLPSAGLDCRLTTHNLVPGRLVRVVLLAIVCDHPAMCKMAGLADHSHGRAPCGKCTVPHEELHSDKAMKNGMRLVA